MPVYEYALVAGHAGCGFCQEGINKLQKMSDEPIRACPNCGAPMERLLFLPAISTPKTNTELKNLGFSKLVKRDTGVYENMTATNTESRYMEAGKPETMPDLKSKIED